MDDTPRLSHRLRAFVTHTSDFDREKALHTLIPQVEAKRKQLAQDKVDRTSMNWNFLKSMTKVQKYSVEEKNGQVYMDLLLKAISDTDIDQEHVPVVAKQFYRACLKGDAQRKNTSVQKITAQLSSLFTVKNIPKDKIDKAMHAAEKLTEWIERNKTGDASPEEEESWDDAVVLSESSYKYEYGFDEDRFYAHKPLDMNILQKEFDRLDPNIPIDDVDEEEQTQDEIASEIPKQATISWLREECHKLFGSPDLSENILMALSKKGVDEVEIQAKLFDMLGENGFDFMQQIFEGRHFLVREFLNKKLSTLTGGVSKTKSQQALESVRITSNKQIELEKRLRRENKKVNKLKQQSAQQHANDENQLDWLTSLGYQKPKTTLSTKHTASIMSMSSSSTPQSQQESLRDRLQLPTVQPKRVSHPGYEEFHIPPATCTDHTDPLISIDEFDDFAKTTFKGITHLNRVQSRVFHAAYKTNENLLICAPTGCGKTNIALMSMLHEIGLHFRNGKLRHEEFKMIYIAPMKALASEMVSHFSNRFKALGVKVKEMTGDMQLTKQQVSETQLIITTPEKWDVVTRKNSDLDLIHLVKLIIIDEVHLLAEDRGPVIETIVARTLRQIESTQSMIRIVGLSATLPNYQDVATFLRVNPLSGLFHFDNSYRPVPLSQQFIAVTASSSIKRQQLYHEITYEKAQESVLAGNQIMVFVHARKATAMAAKSIYEIAVREAELKLFEPTFDELDLKEIGKSRNAQVKELLAQGFGIHHAGMIRQDRHLVEGLFARGKIKVLCCTATLAWGVNLPAHTVIIKGTQVYNAKKGAFVELDMLDVMQIFGRAGRPQFDTHGEGIIITTQEQCPRYLNLLNHALPIESQMQVELANHLSAEVVLGTVTSVREAMQWLSYTYMFIRMLCNPLSYGITHQEQQLDPMLTGKRRQLVESACTLLSESKMVLFDLESGIITATDLGRVSSHYYIHYETVQTINKKLSNSMDELAILHLIASSKEFENVKLRDDEFDELVSLSMDVPVKLKNGLDSSSAKINLLIQIYISRLQIKNFSLVSDMAYIVQSVGRIVRALFEISLKRGWTNLVYLLLTLNKCIEKQMWNTQHPLSQFHPLIHPSILEQLSNKRITLSMLEEMQSSEMDAAVNQKRVGHIIQQALRQFPTLCIDHRVQPITRNVLRIELSISIDFEWNKKYHGDQEPWWIWLQDDESSELIYHSESFLINKEHTVDNPLLIHFIVPIRDNPRPNQFIIRAVSDKWLQAECMELIPLKDIVLPAAHPPLTKLLPLVPLPLKAFNNPHYESLYPHLEYFNPIQTQVFHTLYHSDHNVLIGAPTGSGKTLIAEMSIFRCWNETPDRKIIYIAPLKALVRERVKEWSNKLCAPLGKSLVELTGDVTPDIKLLKSADLVITTPEKWDGVSRNWQQRAYVRQVGLVIMDEIHLLGSDRGAILEVIVSRMRYVSWYTKQPIRMLGLSSTLANARDLADWLGITSHLGLYNFRPSVRPVPLNVHIQGFSGKHYCPRMATMNRPAYAAILKYSRRKPVLIFVSSRRQTRLTALDLISYCAADEDPQQFVKMDPQELQYALSQVNELNLRHTLQYGIGIHHAGLSPTDKNIVENLFVNHKIQVLVCTSTLAWGVNFPAHLVIVKGTEFFDADTKRYVDYPITDVLQMMGRAGRPQYDQSGEAYIMVQDTKKNFYKKFLYEAFPVESSLKDSLHEHICAEIVSGTITTRQEAMDYLTWTFMFRRLVQNPTYYDLSDTSFEGLRQWMTHLIDGILLDLKKANCIEISDEEVQATGLGMVSSFYYMKYTSISDFDQRVKPDDTVEKLIELVARANEFDEIPVRHNEDQLNASLAKTLPIKSYSNDYDDSHVKTFLLFVAHLSGSKLPIADYATDTKTVLDSSIRVIQAFVDVASEKGYLSSVLNLCRVMQMILQAQWHTDSDLYMLPHITLDQIDRLKNNKVTCVKDLVHHMNALSNIGLRSYQVDQIKKVMDGLPFIQMKVEDEFGHDPIDKVTSITIHMKDYRKGGSQKNAYVPKFTKQKDEGWWLIIAEPSKNELLAIKRIRLSRETQAVMVVPDMKKGTVLKCYLQSDCYLGLDQEAEFVV